MPRARSPQVERWSAELRLRGAAGEPVDLWRTLLSHGMVVLPPLELDREARALEITLHAGRGRPRTVRVEAGRRGWARVRASGAAPSERQGRAIVERVAHVLRLDEDLSEFYAVAREDPELAWVAQGAGRLVRSATVFEDVVKTICTTNCAWSGTERMVGALVEHLGEKAPGAPPEGTRGRAFPTPEAMARAPLSFYKDVARAGYRGAYLRDLARDVARGRLDLEALAAPSLECEEVEERLLALPGVGPYAAAHIMMMIGRYERLVLDSWTRPKYASVCGKRKVADTTIARRFKGYGRYAGLAFWLTVTEDWVE